MRDSHGPGALAAPSRIMEFLSDKFGLKSAAAAAAAGKGGDFYLAPGAPLEHVMEALDSGEASFYGKGGGGGKCVAQAAYSPHGRLDRASPARDGSGECAERAGGRAGGGGAEERAPSRLSPRDASSEESWPHSRASGLQRPARASPTTRAFDCGASGLHQKKPLWPPHPLHAECPGRPASRGLRFLRAASRETGVRPGVSDQRRGCW